MSFFRALDALLWLSRLLLLKFKNSSCDKTDQLLLQSLITGLNNGWKFLSKNSNPSKHLNINKTSFQVRKKSCQRKKWKVYLRHKKSSPLLKSSNFNYWTSFKVTCNIKVILKSPSGIDYFEFKVAPKINLMKNVFQTWKFFHCSNFHHWTCMNGICNRECELKTFLRLN